MDTKRVITYSNMLGEMSRNSNNGKNSSSKLSTEKEQQNEWYNMYKNLVPERPLLNKNPEMPVFKTHKEVKENQMLLMTPTEKLLGAKKVHEHSGHKQSENMAKILKGSEVGEKKIIDEVIKRCKICQKSQKGQDVPKVSTFKPKTFNEIVTVDLKINI